MPLPQVSELTDQLFEAARARASQHGMKLRPVVTGQLKALAGTGAQKILTAATTKPPDAQEAYVRGAVRVATEAMATVVDEMIVARLWITNYAASHPDSVGEQTLTRALALLCPLWPF